VKRRKSLVTDVTTSAKMRKIRQFGTTPELCIRRLITGLGLRYRIANRDLPGSPDLANRSRRWVVFVHGCFWHRHEGCKRTTTPARNRGFWLNKFRENVDRDERKRRELIQMGFGVLVIWECETKVPSKALRKLRRFMQTGQKPV